MEEHDCLGERPEKRTDAANGSPTIPRRKKNRFKRKKRSFSVSPAPLAYLYYDTFARSDDLTLKSLWRMVQDLKKLDATWRGVLSAQPNFNERCLYRLILVHVCSDIFLFHHEKNLRLPRGPEYEGEWIVKEVRDRASNFGAILISDNMNVGGEEEDDYISRKDFNDKLSGNWPFFNMLIHSLCALRDSVCALPQRSIVEVLEGSQSSEIGTEHDKVDAKQMKEIARTAEREVDGGQSIEMGLDGGKAEAKEGTDLKKPLDRKIPEHTLRSILWGLACRRQERSYAPPLGEELMCYREIRKWVSSTISFIEAKISWLCNWGIWWGETECGNDFATQRLKIVDDWESMDVSIGPIEFTFSAPKGHGIAATFDELSEFRSFLSEWKKRFIEISTTRFYGDKLSNLVTTDDAYPDVVRREKSHVRPEWEVKKKRKHNVNVLDASEVAAQRSMPAPRNDEPLTDSHKMTTNNHFGFISSFAVAAVAAQSCKPVPENDKLMGTNSCVNLNGVDTVGVSAQGSMPAPGNDMPMRINRILYLMDILATFGSMGYPSCSPTTRELRLYYHILEHLRTSTWLFLSRETTEEKIQRLNKSTGNEDFGLSMHVVAQAESSEQKTREDYLQKIVSVVEQIESLFWLSHLSVGEFFLYEKILVHIDEDLKQSSYYLTQKAGHGTGTEQTDLTAKMALARRVLKTTGEWQIKLVSTLRKDIGDTLRTIFTKMPPKETKVTEWLEEHMEEAVCDLKELATKGPRGLELFDRLLLSMIEVDKFFGKILRKFSWANHSAYYALDAEKLYQVALMEGWSALRVLESANVF